MLSGFTINSNNRIEQTRRGAEAFSFDGRARAFSFPSYIPICCHKSPSCPKQVKSQIAVLLFLLFLCGACFFLFFPNKWFQLSRIRALLYQSIF